MNIGTLSRFKGQMIKDCVDEMRAEVEANGMTLVVYEVGTPDNIDADENRVTVWVTQDDERVIRYVVG